MFILQIVGWFIFSAIVISFIEHQVHYRMMHRRSFGFLKRTFEAHAIAHHGYYSKIFSDEPGPDKDIRLNVYKAPIKTIPVIAAIALVSWQGALVFVATVYFHHWVWNKIHLEMHKPERRGFSQWPIYKFLARYHWLHHRYPDKNLNVVFPFADYVLGTRARPNEADLLRMREQLEGHESKQKEYANVR